MDHMRLLYGQSDMMVSNFDSRPQMSADGHDDELRVPTTLRSTQISVIRKPNGSFQHWINHDHPNRVVYIRLIGARRRYDMIDAQIV
jgi:hypothetical protein